MPEAANILVVSDLHFGEELLPGCTTERRTAVELGGKAFREFLHYHTSRRLGGRPWRLVIAGDLFDFMSVVIPGTHDLPARTPDERKFGLERTAAAGVLRMRRICENHKPLLADMVRFAAAGHSIDIVVGNHDAELLMPEVCAELDRQIRDAGASDAAAARIQVVPWFVYVPGACWIEHGHVYDEGCSFEFNLAPVDPRDHKIISNIDYAAIRYFATTVPEIDPSSIETWGFAGFMQYGWDIGARSFMRLWAGYARFAAALVRARTRHQSHKSRNARRHLHRERLAQVAEAGGISVDTASQIDRLARTPMTVSWRRLGRMLMLDRFSIGIGLVLLALLLFLLLPFWWALLGFGVGTAGATALHTWLGKHMVTSQLPMRAVPMRLRKLVDAPVIVFGHTHDPRWQPLRNGGLYLNSGTWLPATRPGLRRSFTHILIQPRADQLPLVELRQWREGTSQPFDARADLGAGVTAPGHINSIADWTKVA
jgi:UDP-2,3-diacylglucosamine pyrophosphatase LpxH